MQKINQIGMYKQFEKHQMIYYMLTCLPNYNQSLIYKLLDLDKPMDVKDELKDDLKEALEAGMKDGIFLRDQRLKRSIGDLYAEEYPSKVIKGAMEFKFDVFSPDIHK
jgi:Mg/Co/Ni transporter MgtE